MKRIWITGYRAYELGIFKENDPKIKIIKELLKRELKQRLENSDEDFWVITGPQMGIERWGIETARTLKRDYPQLRIALMEPYADFARRWNENNQAKLLQIKEAVDYTGKVSEKPYESPMQLRAYQNFMLHYTDEALLIYDPDYAGKTQWDLKAIRNYQAANQDYLLRLIDFDELQEMAEEYAERLREQNFD